MGIEVQNILRTSPRFDNFSNPKSQHRILKSYIFQPPLPLEFRKLIWEMESSELHEK